MRLVRHKSSMRFVDTALLGIVLCASASGCNSFLRLDILNSTDDDIVVVVEGSEKRVEPGLSYSGTYPANGETIIIRTKGCSRDYIAPDLDQSPWKYLIGHSVKFRAVSTGMLIAYPPTPDVELKGNPLRAMRDGSLVLHPVRASCRVS